MGRVVMKKSVLRILFILLIFAIVSMACIGGVDDGSAQKILSDNQISARETQSISATATFGAEQFQIQLTAIAEQKTP